MGITPTDYQLSRRRGNSLRGLQHTLHSMGRTTSYSQSTGNSPTKWTRNVRSGLDHTNQQTYLEKRNLKEHNWPHIYTRSACRMTSLLQTRKCMGHYHRLYTHTDSIKCCSTNAVNLSKIHHKETWPEKVYLKNL